MAKSAAPDMEPDDSCLQCFRLIDFCDASTAVWSCREKARADEEKPSVGLKADTASLDQHNAGMKWMRKGEGSGQGLG